MVERLEKDIDLVLGFPCGDAWGEEPHQIEPREYTPMAVLPFSRSPPPDFDEGVVGGLVELHDPRRARTS